VAAVTAGASLPEGVKGALWHYPQPHFIPAQAETGLVWHRLDGFGVVKCADVGR
jgi:hypothetical protein